MISSVGTTAYSAAGAAHFAPKPKLKEFLDSLSESDAELIHGYLSKELTAPLVRLELLLREDERKALLERLRAEGEAKALLQSTPEEEEEEEEEP